MPRSPSLLAAGLAVALILPAPVLAQGGPEEAYRASWASGFTPADPGAERFRSRILLEEFRAFLEEEPEMAADMLDYMTALYRELQEAAEPGAIEVLEQAADRVVLEVEFRGRNGPLPEGLPRSATVEMLLEADGWKVGREGFSGSIGGGGDGGGYEDPCPAGTVLGDTSAPHTLQLQKDGGVVQLHFNEALLLKDGDDLTLRLPVMGSSQMEVRVRRGAATPGDHGASLEGMLASGGCPGFPETLLYDEPPVLFTWQAATAPGTADVDFDVSAPDGGEMALVSGSLQAVPVVDVTPGPLLPGSFLLAFDDEVNPDRGAVLHHPAEARLEISLEYSRGNGGGSSSFSVNEFTGGPGVYVGDVRFGAVQLAVVEEFGGGRIRMELREIPEEDFSGGEPDLATALGMGILRARVVTDRVVEIPALGALAY